MSGLIRELSTSEQVGARERQSTIRLLRAIVVVTLVAVVAIVISDGIIGGRPQIVAVLVPLAVFMGISIVLLNRQVLWPARLLVPVALFVVLSYLIVIGGGIHDVAMIAFTAVLVIASLTLGRNAPVVFGVFIVVAIAIIGVLEINGTIVNQGSFITTWDELVLMSIIVLAVAGLLRLLVTQLNVSVRRAQENERAQTQANQALRELQAVLENRVEERTHELAQRTRYLEATAQVAREATATLEQQDLLTRVVALVSEQFGFYHVALFLLDTAGGEWLVLKAASSEGGQRLLAQDHRLRVAEQGVIVYVMRQGRAYAVADVDNDPLFRANQELPETCSEIALPLRARGAIIGVLDLQSTVSRTFTGEEVTTLQVLADQIALAINNAELFRQTQESLEAERRAYGEMSLRAWAQLAQSHAMPVYRSRQGVVIPVEATTPEPPESEDLPTLQIPVRVRGQVVATIQARKSEPQVAWSEHEAAIVETLGEQLGTALESARLYQDTQRRAARESAIREIADDIQRATDMESLMRITAEALNRTLGGSRVYVRLAEPEPRAAEET